MLIALLKPTEVTYLDMGRAEKKALRVDDQLVSLSCNGKPRIVQWKVGLYSCEDQLSIALLAAVHCTSS